VFARFGCGALHIDVELENQLGQEFFDELRRSGYDFDLINDRALDRDAKVNEGKLRIGKGTYSVIIVPGARFMPPQALERLAEFAESGGTLILTERLPEAAPGLPHQEERTARLHAMMKRLWGNTGPTSKEGVSVGKGRVVFAATRAGALEQIPNVLTPDCFIVEAGGNSENALNFARVNVGFLHRRLGSRDFYFLSNISSEPRRVRMRFAVGHRQPERWDPETGSIDEVLPYFYSVVGAANEEVTEVQLRLDAFESCFVVFGESREQPVVTRTNFWGPLRIEKKTARRIVTGLAEENAKFWFETPQRKRRLLVKGIPESLRVGGPWTLKLGKGPPIALAALRSWNDIPEGKSYSGWATYETTIEIAELGPDLEWVLDLGTVHETAEAELSGVALGAAWKGKRELRCSNAIRVGKNQLIVRVANLWIHRMRSLPEPDSHLLAETYGIRRGRYGEISAKELPPSGLLGPVRLVPLKRWTLNL
jgi:hypothetical protein